MKKSELRKIIREEIHKLNESTDIMVREDRLPPETADYEVKLKKGIPDKIIAKLKNQKAGAFTKLIQSIEEVESLKTETENKKRELNIALNDLKSKDVELNTNITDYVLGLFDASEQANTLTVECYGSALTLNKKTEKNEPSTSTKSTIDYKKAWEMIHNLFEGKEGLIEEMNQILTQCTNVQTILNAGAKRGVRTKLKGESILREDNIFTRTFKAVKNSIMKYLRSFKIWKNTFSNKLDGVNQFINSI